MQNENDLVVNALVGRFLQDYTKVAAEKLEDLERSETAELLAGLPADRMVVVWEALSPGLASDVLALLPAEQRTELAKRADLGKLAILLSRMDEKSREAFLVTVRKAEADELRELMSYPPDVAGQLMDTRVTTFRSHQTVEEVSRALRQRTHGTPVVQLKIVDEAGRLQSIVRLTDFAIAQPEEAIGSIARPVVAVVGPMDPREDVVEKLQGYSLEELPVVNSDGMLLGIIRHSELIEALREQSTLDIQTMVGASREERATSSSWFAMRKRMPWLQINLLTAFLAAAVVGLFEETISKVTALAILLPVVAGQSGNAGSQALAVTMRGLALREIRVGQWPRVMIKEINAGFWNGVAIAITCGAAVYVWSGQIGLVIIIATSMIIAMTMAGIAGALVPITMKRLGQDPAVASSIVLTTITDVAGFFSFLGIASLLLSTLS